MVGCGLELISVAVGRLRPRGDVGASSLAGLPAGQSPASRASEIFQGASVAPKSRGLMDR